MVSDFKWYNLQLAKTAEIMASYSGNYVRTLSISINRYGIRKGNQAQLPNQIQKCY